MLCPDCGANIKFDIASQKMLCPYCQSSAEPESLDSAEAQAQESFDAFLYSCPQCGGKLSGDVNEAAVFCPYCGNSTLIEGRLSKRKRPKYIIPFQITKEDCVHAYQKLLRRSVYAPDSLRKYGVPDSFRGIYMPHWTFTVSQNEVTALPGSIRYSEFSGGRDEHYNCRFHLDNTYEGLSYDASELFDDALSLAISPYQAEGKKAFSPGYMSGFYADTFDVDAKNYRENAELFATEESFKRLKQNPNFKKYNIAGKNIDSSIKRNLHTHVTASEISMMPVWFLSYRYKDRLTYAGINGQTGKAAGLIPASPLRYILFSLLVTIPLFFLVNLLSFPSPETAMMTSNLLALFVYLIFHRELAEAVHHERFGRVQQYINGVPVTAALPKIHRIARTCSLIIAVISGLFFSGGMLSRSSFDFFAECFDFAITILLLILTIGSIRPLLSSFPLKNRYFHLLIPFGGICILVVHILKPVQDLYYYLMCIFQIAASCMTFIDLIYYHNILATRAMPQFDRTGGDDRA